MYDEGIHRPADRTNGSLPGGMQSIALESWQHSTPLRRVRAVRPSIIAIFIGSSQIRYTKTRLFKSRVVGRF